MADVVTEDSSIESCPDCGGDIERSSFDAVDSETGSRVLSCVDCEFKGVESWDFVRVERMG